LARRMALARGQSVTVCPSVDGLRCGFGSSGSGWILFANDPAGSEARVDGSDEVLHRWELPASVAVSGTRGYANFQARPGAAATVTFEFQHAGDPAAVRRVVVSQTG